MIYTWSKFTYGHTVTVDNQSICFKEPTKDNVELIAVIPVGNYTLGEYAFALADAMNSEGELTYQTSIDRSTNVITITASDVFSILISSASSSATAYEMMGFSQTSNLTGLTTYSGTHPSGVEYYPQFLLQSYVPPDHWVQSADATVNQSADGRVEIIRFGVEKKIEFDIKFITNLPMDGQVIKNNPQGLEQALDFLSYIAQKKKFEFFPDLNSEDYYKVILESIEGSSKGTGFKLRELFSQSLPDVYETGLMQLRVVN